MSFETITDFEKVFVDKSYEEIFFNEYKELQKKYISNLTSKLTSAELKITRTKDKIQEASDKLMKQNEFQEDLEMQLMKSQKELELLKEKETEETKIYDEHKQLNIELKTKLENLDKELQTKMKNIKTEWKSIVKGCNMYKKHLDMHIRLDKTKNDEVEAQVTFFIQENPDKNNFYVVLRQLRDNWIVNRIVPELSPEDKSTLAKFPEELSTMHVRTLLCTLRQCFLKYQKNNRNIL